MDEKIEVNNKTVIDLAKIIHKHNQYIQADWEEYTNSDVALAYAIKWNGYRKESDTAREILTLIKNGVELNSMIDGDAKIAIMNELRWAGQRYDVDLGE